MTLVKYFNSLEQTKTEEEKNKTKQSKENYKT